MANVGGQEIHEASMVRRRRPQENAVENAMDEEELQENAVDEEVLRNLEEKVEKKEEQILKMETSVFQLANYHFVFQGVILTATINGSSSSLKCQYFWLPFFMSLVGAILNFGTLIIIADKYKESLDDLDDRYLTLYQYMHPTTFKMLYEKHKEKKAMRKTTLVSSKILFLIFTALNLIATLIIPCFS